MQKQTQPAEPVRKANGSIWDNRCLLYTSAMTLAHRAVRDVRRDGFRQLRNYVDMCALLAQRPDLKRFFEHAQTVLQRTDSLYYKLINNLVAQVNEDAICTAGINLGFDAIISCASNNRKQNGETRSWLNVGFCSAPELDDAIIQAEAGSSYAWVLYADEDLTPKTVAMLQSHTHSAVSYTHLDVYKRQVQHG